ncbi:helix-turn-helix domain-containing protein [Haladaptatus sp. CMAA 1911]|uniref:helix-turn-helix domain-containing protein n=1 Tax=unclassified Haladaptatus TaxID=2622732 RepID=UPI003754DB22
MSVLTEFTVPADEFILYEALKEISETYVEIERVVANSEYVTPYFWVSTDSFEQFEQALDEDKTVKSITLLEDHDSERLYRVSWRQRTGTIGHAVSQLKASILEATSDGSKWNLKLLFPSKSSLTKFHDYCSDFGILFRLTSLYESRHLDAFGKYEVTSKQREALMVALDLGYFNIPREATLEHVAEKLDISPNALSTRLRRGHANLITNTLQHEG